MINIIFFGSSEYSIIILKKLLQIKDFNIQAIFTKPDKAVGRSQQITPNPIAKFANENNLPLFQPESFDKNFELKIKNLNPDIGLCVAFGPPYFTKDLIDIPKFKIINIHPSRLPKYRGATPGPWQIINGESKSAVTFFQIDALPDHGPIITQIPFGIDKAETSTTFYQKAFEIASDNLETVIKSYISNPNDLTIQDHTQKTYFPKLNKDNAKIDWSWDIQKVERFVRALNPWPIAWTEVKNQQNQILKMKIFNFNTEPVEVQIEGKKLTNWSEISNYYQIQK